MESSVGAQVVSTSLLFIFTLPSVGANLRIDPLCISKKCPPTEECRVAKWCFMSRVVPLTCWLKPVCVERNTLRHHGCPIGRPLLRKRNQMWEIASCSPGIPCPKNFYCKQERENLCCRCDTGRLWRGLRSAFQYIANASSSEVSVETTITNLPDVVLSSIFQHLHWKEKLMAVKAFPAWNRILHSTLGWKDFENDRYYAQSVQALVSNNYLLEEITCIAQYGQFFTHAVIWLEVFPSADNPQESDLALLGALETHCFRLKSLVIYHPPKLSPSSIKRSGARYIKPLQRMFSFNPSLDLSLCRVSFLSEGTQAGLCKLLDWYQEHNVLQKVACLDFSLGKMESTLRPMNSLVYCTSLRVLKCPIEYLNTQILQQLVEFNLQELYVVKDMDTVHHNYDEQSEIDWHGLQLIPGRNLKVHYVFRFSDVVLCPNPYARSLALDSLCDGISRELLVSIADTYGATLEMFSFIGVVWYPSDLDVMFSDLEDLPTTFEYLASRLTCVHTVVLNLFIPKDALISLARHAPALKTLLVYEHKILFGEHAANTEIEELKQIISEAIGYSWKPLSENDTFYELSAYRKSLLFEDFFLDCLDR